MADDLFSGAAEDRRAARAPLADRLRPTRLDDVVGQDHLLGPGRPLRTLIEADRLTSAILWGPPGTGKTSLARVVARSTASHFEPLSAVSATVKDVRTVAEQARRRLGERGVGTILFLDEVHRFTKTQQDALLPHVEDGLLTLIGATTENPYFSVNAPLLSRSTLFRLHPVDDDALADLVGRALDHEGATADADAVATLVRRSEGDARRALTSLEVAIGLAGGGRHVGLAEAEAALDTRAIRYGDDEHYDIISAFIKSIRGSDVDAGLHWLARMLEAGEDPRYVARRLVVLASEDVGMADPTALPIATAAAQAVELVGMPEASYALAQAVVHLGTAPKSNSVAAALWLAREDVRQGRGREVPAHLRNSQYRGAAELGHGVGYRYPHDHASGWIDQGYRPPDIEDRVYYRPSGHGAEPDRARRAPGPQP